MFNQVEQFITQMKLRELLKQRDAMRATYDALAAEVEAAGTMTERLTVLYEGLQAITFAGQKLHPEVANLDVLFAELDAREEGELAAYWLAQLEGELETGRLRAEFIYVFGALLAEWADTTRSDEEAAERAAFAEGVLAEVSQPVPERDYRTFLEPLSAYLPRVTAIDVEAMQEGVDSYELMDILIGIARDTFRPEEIRQQAKVFLRDEALRKEFADAITIMLENRDDWAWDEEGVLAHIVWMRTKWRLMLDEGLPTIAMLEVLGDRWFERFIRWGFVPAARQMRNFRHRTYYHGAKIHQETRELLAAREPFAVRLVDLWRGETFESGDPEALITYLGDEYGVIDLRLYNQTHLRQIPRVNNYAHYVAAMERALKLIHADITFTRAAFPGKPLYIAKADLKNFYPSIPHDLVRTLLEGIEMPEAERAFFDRWMAVPIRYEGEVTRSARGLPINSALSHTLAEMLLTLMDTYIQQRAEVHIVRQVDDICLMALDAEEMVKGWQALTAFCEACDLAINMDKAGAVCIGGELPTGLPTTPPTWMLVALNADGEWVAAEDEVIAHLGRVRARVNREPGIIEKVEQYNEGLTYLTNATTPWLPLGEAHRASIQAALERFHYEFAGEGTGIADVLRDLVRERFTNAVPEAWLYWPITAGGLGLKQPLVEVATYSEAWDEHTPEPVPTERDEGWLTDEDSPWAHFYSEQLVALRPGEPTSTKVMETLVKDFASRGGEISGGQISDLGPYWRWVLYTYGPQILDAFGTFRFLLTELVPVQLILQKRSASE